MRLTKSTHYALCAALEMAGARERPVSVAEVAERNGIPQTALAKVFQQLVRAGLAHGTRGVGGGYRLARPASRVTLLDVIRAFEAPEPPALGPRARRTWSGQRLYGLFAEVDELVGGTFESVTLETLARGPTLKVALPGPKRRVRAAP
jgi:Rrf2 family protein